MQSVVLDAPEVLRLEDRAAPPRPGSREAVVDVLTSGICGTDLSIFMGKIPVKHPLVMGHEMFGRVRDVGSGVEGLGPGARVVVDPAISCGTCYQCSKGQTQLCPRGALLGRDRDGGFTEAITVPSSNVYVVPDSIDNLVGPLIQVLTTCMHAQRSVPLHPGDSALVIGLGVTGLMHLQIARARGAGTLLGVTRSSSKRALAEKLGADATFDPSDPDLHSHIQEATQGRGPDVVIECAGTVETFAKAIELVRIGGHVCLYGTITAERGELPYYQLYYKELTITNPRAAKPEDFPAAIELAASRAVELRPIVSHIFPLERAEQAIGTIRSGEGLKVVMEHGGESR